MTRLAAIAALLCTAIYSQSDPPQVVGHVVDSVTGQGVAAANVTLYTPQAERYRAASDESGTFRLSGIDKGGYEVAVEKSGFVLFAKEPLQIGDGTATPTYELEFSETPKATLRGRVLDSQGKPIANAPVDVIRGPSLSYRKITDSEGRFSFDKLGIGSYKLRAAPPTNYPGFEVATYFPGWVDESAAPSFEVKGDAEVNGFRLATSRGVHLRGVVRDEENHPVANAIVKLLPVSQQPAHVVVSFDSTFLAIPEGSGTGPAEAELRTDADGAFDFASVRTGGWQIVAHNQALSGSVPVSVANEDVQIDLQIKAPATISSLPITWAVLECTTPIGPSGLCAVNGRKAPEGVVYPIWFQAADGQSSVLRLVVTGNNSTSSLVNITPGRFIPVPLPTRGLLPLPKYGNLGSSSSFPSIVQLDSRAVGPGQPVDLDRGSRSLDLGGGGNFDGDGTLPPFTRGKPGRLRGTVVNGAEAIVVIAHEDRGRIWGQVVQCRADGTFALDPIDSGDYGIVAFRTMDLERMRDPAILRMVLSSTKIRVSESSTAEARITQIF